MSPSLRQALLLAAFLPWCWLAMQAVHELGHVLGALATGATIERVVLHPLALSQTVLADNPRPLPVAWAGALVGCVLPLLAWALARLGGGRLGAYGRCFAGFCLVANGAYLGLGVVTGDGDAGDLLTAGAAAWQLVAFGVIACAAGLWVWHGLAPAMGLGRGSVVARRDVLVVASLLALTIALEMVCA